MAKQSVEKRLLQAQSLMRKGALQDARAAVQSVLQDFPANKKAKQLLMKVDEQRSAGPVAAPLADQSKITNLVRIFESGDVARAADLASRYTKQFPRSALVWNVAAAANKVLGRKEVAIEYFERVVQINPTDADAHFNLALLMQDVGRLRAASDGYRRALGLRPDDAEVHNNLGKALDDLGNSREALKHYEHATRLDPNFAQAFYNLGVLKKEVHDLSGAIQAFKRTLEIEPENDRAHDSLGSTYIEFGNEEEAIASYEAALKISPNDPKLLTGYSNVLITTGQREKAVNMLEQAIALSPTFAKAHRALSMAKTYSPDDPHLKQLLDLHRSEEIDAHDKCLVSFALAKAYEDLEDLEKTFQFLEEGGALRTTKLEYALETDIRLFSDIKSFDLEPVRSYTNRQKAAFEPTPIFILGMPRSGTTLTEQIISSHSQVYGAGELRFVSKLGKDLVEGKVQATDETFDEFREGYSAFLTEVSQGEPFVIDKMPHNFRFIGLICELFPKARIVHTKRNPQAVCWSNYKLYFPAQGLGYSFNLENTAAYYKMYEDMMAFWDKTYGDRIIHLNYEALTQDQEHETRKLISDLGLEWEESCLSPHKNTRVARTASSQQVKEKVYQGSSAKWKAFEPFIGTAFDRL